MKNLDTVYAERIASEYDQKPASKLVALKKLDRKAKPLPAQVFTYTFGVIGTLLLGVGMCLCMGVIGQGLSMAMPLGIVVGVVGIGMVSVNYPVHKRLLEQGRKKYAFEIMELAKDITAENAWKADEQVGEQIFPHGGAHGRGPAFPPAGEGF